jgi:hypothetical protein
MGYRVHAWHVGCETMTPAEHRAQCVEAMAIAMALADRYGIHAFDNSHGQVPLRIRLAWTELPDNGHKYYDAEGGECYSKGKNDWREEATIVLDSLHGIARVDPIEATEEMIAAGSDAEGYSEGDIHGIWKAMAAAGDLTNPPETKP